MIKKNLQGDGRELLPLNDLASDLGVNVHFNPGPDITGLLQNRLEIHDL